MVVDLLESVQFHYANKFFKMKIRYGYQVLMKYKERVIQVLWSPNNITSRFTIKKSIELVYTATTNYLLHLSWLCTNF